MKGKESRDRLEEMIDDAWKAYQIMLIEHDLPLPENPGQAKLYFRGGFVYCMAAYYKDIQC